MKTSEVENHYISNNSNSLMNSADSETGQFPLESFGVEQQPISDSALIPSTALIDNQNDLLLKTNQTQFKSIENIEID